MSTERICIQSLSDYNNGRLIFEWWDMDDFDSKDEFDQKVSEWLESLGADEFGQNREEWMLADWEGDLMKTYANQYGISSDYWELVEFMASTSLDDEAVAAGVALEIPLDQLEEAYIGEYENDEKYLDSLIDEGVVEIPEHLEAYIDYERLAQAWTQDTNSYNGHYFKANW